MFDYSVFDKLKDRSFGSNPRSLNKRNYKNQKISNRSCEKYNVEKFQVKFKIRIYDKEYKMITIYKDESLEDLCIKIYNAVYPEFSTENKWDIIPPPGGLRRVPRLYYTSVFNAKEEIMLIPVHRFITLESFMQANPEYLKSISYFGPPTYNIYVIDERGLEKIENRTQEKNYTILNYYQKLVNCVTR